MSRSAWLDVGRVRRSEADQSTRLVPARHMAGDHGQDLGVTLDQPAGLFPGKASVRAASPAVTPRQLEGFGNNVTLAPAA
jgi:hypothetical protein